MEARARRLWPRAQPDLPRRAPPRRPFDEHVGGPFADELLDDFPLLDILEQIERFRWYHANQSLALARNPRGALRRWIGRSYGQTV